MEDIKKSIKPIESLLNVTFYHENGRKTEEGRNYATLATIRNELYARNWKKMRKDLNKRLTSRPYIFKLVERIKEDLQRMDRLEEAEKKKPDITDILMPYYYGVN